jgi:3-hydroxyisobutyrate dehydrogenase
MVGAKEEKLCTEASKYLSHMGKNIAFCGPVGHGQIAKVCNNMMLGISMIAASETLNLAQRLGMDPKLMSSILNTSTGRCWSTDTYNPVPGVMVPNQLKHRKTFHHLAITKEDLQLI